MGVVKVITVTKERDIPVEYLCPVIAWLARQGHLGQRHTCEACGRNVSNSEYKENVVVVGGSTGPVGECSGLSHLERMP